MPWPNRSYEEWKGEVSADITLIFMMFRELDLDEAHGGTREGKVRALALARKEARRLERDIERIGSECFGIERYEIDQVVT